MKFSKLFFAALIVLTSTNTFAQDDKDDTHTVTIGIPEIALLDIETDDARNFTLAGEHSTEAGDPINFTNATNNNLWLNYSSIVSAGLSRSVTVSITDGYLPGGLNLNVIASSCTTGKGTNGNPTAQVTLTDSSQDIITGVGSAYTETGNEKGHNLTYSLSHDTAAGAYANLKVDNTTLEITYTLTDDI